jgi:hypothetical protein
LVVDRNRGGAYLGMLIAGAGMFGIFLLLIYYLQITLGYSPVVTGLAVLPMVAVLMVSATAGQVVLMPRTGPRPLVGFGMLTAAAGMVWRTRHILPRSAVISGNTRTQTHRVASA